MVLEIKVIEKNGTWEITKLHDGAKNIQVKRIFKTKMNENDMMDKYKSRLVSKIYI